MLIAALVASTTFAAVPPRPRTSPGTMLKSRARHETWIDMDTKAKLGTAAIGTQSVKVHIDPIMAGFGIGIRF